MRRPALLLLVAAACSSDPSVPLSAYATACTSVDDCAAVFVGDPCTSLCRRDNAAINSADLSRQAASLHAAEDACGPADMPCTASCNPPTVTCAKGMCALE